MEESAIGRPLKSDLVEQRLIEMIQSGELAPGAHLHQRQIAKRFDVSPTPVREAFLRLEAAGLLVSNSHSTARVAEPILPNDPHALKVRAAIENLGIELAVQRSTPPDIAELRRLNQEYADAPTDTAARDCHWRLHYRVFDIAGSPALIAQVRLLWGMLEVGRMYRRDRASSVAHHGELIDAIAAGDIPLAQRLMDAHHNPPEGR